MQTSPSPAVGDSNNAFFFDNRVRAILSRDIMAAIFDGIPFLVLTGPDGSGKTTLISRFVARLPNGIEGIMINQTSHGCRRFDDVLLRLCQHIAMEPAWNGHPDAEQIQRIQEGIRNYLIQKGTRLLLVLDQGEQAFLAMLERVRKMLDAVNDGGVIMHLFLVGQGNLRADLKRLRLAHLQEIPERYFTLPLLDGDDLLDFLRQWLTKARPDVRENTISLRGWHTLCAEAAGGPGRMAALLEERVHTLTNGSTEEHLQASDKTKFPIARQGQKMFAGFSPAALAQRLRDALLAPPLSSKSQPPRPTNSKRRRTTSPLITRRLVSRTRLRRKSILFWGKLYRQSQRLRKRIAPVMAVIFYSAMHAIDKLRRSIAQAARAAFSTVANRPWGKTGQPSSHRPATLGRTIATACATLTRGRRQILSTASQAGSRTATKIPALPPGVLKKSAILLVAVWLVVIGAAALWRSFSRVSLPENSKQEQTQALTEKVGPPPASLDEVEILPVEKPAGAIKPEETEEKPPTPSATAGIPMPTAPKATATMTGKKPKQPTHTREAVKITVGKEKKKVAPEAKKTTRIIRTKTVAKAKPKP